MYVCVYVCVCVCVGGGGGGGGGLNKDRDDTCLFIRVLGLRQQMRDVVTK